MSTPEITVLLPVYNGEEFIRQSVESILNQTLTNFNFLIIDDGSTDRTKEILLQYKKEDSRIYLISRHNKGLIATLNEGLHIAKTKFIVRMDADDISYPTRLETQLYFMKNNPEISVSGSSIKTIETKEKTHFFEDKHDLKAVSIFYCPVAHPTVIFNRNDVLSVGGYSTSAIHAEDYDLWDRMLYAGYSFANIKEELLWYRLNLNKNRYLYYAKMNKTTARIQSRILNRIGIYPSKRNMLLHHLCTTAKYEPSFKIKQMENWMKHILLNNHKYRYVNQESLEKITKIFTRNITTIKFNDHPQKWMRRFARHFIYGCLTLAGEQDVILAAYIENLWKKVKNMKYILNA